MHFSNKENFYLLIRMPFAPKIKEKFGIGKESGDSPELPYNFNVAPSEQVYTVTDDGQKLLVTMRWVLVMPWSLGGNFPLINVRDDNLKTKETFEKKLERKRCIIPADTFYEWKRNERGNLGIKFNLENIPYLHLSYL